MTASSFGQSYSPFTVATLEDHGFQVVEAEIQPPPTPPASYTLGNLISDLAKFNVTYGEMLAQAERTRAKYGGAAAKYDNINVAAGFATDAREGLLRIPGISD